MKTDTAFIVGVVIMMLIIIGVGPLITIWSLNVLLASMNIATIAFTLKTWFATLLLMMAFSAGRVAE